MLGQPATARLGFSPSFSTTPGVADDPRALASRSFAWLSAGDRQQPAAVRVRRGRYDPRRWSTEGSRSSTVRRLAPSSPSRTTETSGRPRPTTAIAAMPRRARRHEHWRTRTPTACRRTSPSARRSRTGRDARLRQPGRRDPRRMSSPRPSSRPSGTPCHRRIARLATHRRPTCLLAATRLGTGRRRRPGPEPAAPRGVRMPPRRRLDRGARHRPRRAVSPAARRIGWRVAVRRATAVTAWMTTTLRGRNHRAAPRGFDRPSRRGRPSGNAEPTAGA